MSSIVAITHRSAQVIVHNILEYHTDCARWGPKNQAARTWLREQLENTLLGRDEEAY